MKEYNLTGHPDTDQALLRALGKMLGSYECLQSQDGVIDYRRLGQKFEETLLELVDKGIIEESEVKVDVK